MYDDSLQSEDKCNLVINFRGLAGFHDCWFYTGTLLSSRGGVSTRILYTLYNLVIRVIRKNNGIVQREQKRAFEKTSCYT